MMHKSLHLLQVKIWTICPFIGSTMTECSTGMSMSAINCRSPMTRGWTRAPSTGMSLTSSCELSSSSSESLSTFFFRQQLALQSFHLDPALQKMLLIEEFLMENIVQNHWKNGSVSQKNLYPNLLFWTKSNRSTTMPVIDQDGLPLLDFLQCSELHTVRSFEQCCQG